MTVTVIDSPYSNIRNVVRALERIGAEVRLTSDPKIVEGADRVILPGVGSFAASRQWLRAGDLDTAIRSAVARGTALLGICVGYQLFFDASEEMGWTEGFGFFKGVIRRFETGRSVPQIGWNPVGHGQTALFDGIEQETPFFFANSYQSADVSSSHCVATADYGGPFVAAAENGRIAGVQFHPERSGQAGLQLLRNFVSRQAGQG